MVIGPVELRVTASSTDAEIVNDLLWSAGPSAIEERVADGTRRMLVAGFPARVQAERAARIVAGLAASDAISAVDIEVAEIIDDTWLDRWRDHAAPVRAGAFLIRPLWQGAPAQDGADISDSTDSATVVLRLDPGRAFGSGSHPTTRLMLGVVEREVTPGVAVLDVGCGSGVLSVAAAALGAVPVVAVDIDPVAVAATVANAEANGLAGRVTSSGEPLAVVRGEFDVVLANLLASVIEAAADDLMARVAAGGRLVLSGLLEDRWRRTAARFAGWSVGSLDAEDGWVAVTLVRTGECGGRAPERAAADSASSYRAPP